MGHRRILTGEQIAQLFDPPTDRRGIIRHYTLSATDLAMIRRGRGDHHRLGLALMRKHPVKAAVLLFCWLLGRRDVAIGSV